MKHAITKIILLLLLAAAGVANAQQLTYDYRYDDAGNRIRRAVVRINNRSFPDEPTKPLTDVMGDGATMRLYPNPTKESIRFELAGDKRIGTYVLTDVTGRPLISGVCEESHLTLDLCGLSEGVYLLDLFIDEKPCSYKIIKQ